MTFFSAFAVSLGAQLALMAIIAGWLFRSSGAPLWTKIAVPTLAVAIACAAPLQVNDLLGLPRIVALRDLPAEAELVAFLPHDERHTVDLWLLAGDDVPHAYEVALDEKMKKTLRAAQGELGAGRPAMLVKRMGGPRGKFAVSDLFAIGDDQTEFVLDESARSTLPSKE
ncbi:MAG TPA: hypothetical protein VMI72_12720 [Roseiarcus sp.]|nr:hypothetical protein [Roseiarcus sp.]